jgi:hypothetical protein
MLRKNTITSKDYWKQQFGLYPMLLAPKYYHDKFLMLNGGSKDFCLQINSSENNSIAFFSDSWSTNTKNFVAFNKDYVHVYNWLNSKPVKHQKKQVEENPDQFYAYLSSNSYKTPKDAVPYIIGIFRELRNLTGNKDPSEALNLLFRLLICIDVSEDYSTIDSSLWGIDNIKIPSKFDYYVDLIRQGVNSISPNRDLILRHVSGALFQEAHKEVIYFDPQPDLFGGFSNKIITKDDFYSSVHYTPPYLARTIVENCLSQLDLEKEKIKIFDPACGSSEFLIEALKQLQNLGYKGEVNIAGWDSSLSAVCTSKFLLHYEQRTQWGKDNLKFNIMQVENSLTEQWDNDWDLIVMNPPFISWELLKGKNSRNVILDTLGSSYERKRPNIASAFFYKAVKSLNENGAIGCVLPYSIFTSDVYTTIRQEIREKINIKLVAKLGNYVFESALTDVCFVIVSKGNSVESSKLVWCKNEKSVAQDALIDLRKMEANNQQSIEKSNYSIYYSRFPLNADNWKVISHKNTKFKQNLDRFVIDGELQPIANIFSVNQGALSGLKNIFIVPKKYYSGLSKDEKIYFRPVITNKSIKCGQLDISEYIWFPYNNDGLILKKEAELKSITFAKEILFPNKKKLSERAGIKGKKWWELTRERTWQYKKGIRLYSSRFGNSDSFAIDVKGNCVIEEGNALVNENFTTNDYYFYLSVFTSNIFDFLLSIYSKELAGGKWYDLGAKHTKPIPIPNVNAEGIRESEYYSRLVELGKELTNGNIYVKHAISDVVKLFYPKTEKS